MISNCGYQRYHGFPTTLQPHCRIYGSGTGMVCHGTGTVWENPTCGLPILNPKNQRRRISHLCNFTFRLHLTLISLSHLSVALSIIVPLCTPSPKLHPTLPCLALSCPPSPYVISSWIHLGILHIHYISYISLFLIGC